MSRYNDVRTPIEYVVDQHFQLQRTLRANMEEDHYTPPGGDYIDENLPEYPLLILRDNQDRAYKFIYGNLDALEDDSEESDPIIWQEELIRDGNKVISIIKTYPDGEEVENFFIRNSEGKLDEIV